MSDARRLRRADCREDVLSEETWNGGDGLIRSNYLQQRELDTSEAPATPLEAAGTTDIWGITE